MGYIFIGQAVKQSVQICQSIFVLVKSWTLFNSLAFSVRIELQKHTERCCDEKR